MYEYRNNGKVIKSNVTIQTIVKFITTVCTKSYLNSHSYVCTENTFNTCTCVTVGSPKAKQGRQ